MMMSPAKVRPKLAPPRVACTTCDVPTAAAANRSPGPSRARRLWNASRNLPGFYFDGFGQVPEGFLHRACCPTRAVFPATGAMRYVAA